MSRSNRFQRGVSLVEALVAFAVLAFGMLGVVGMQSTMRSNADMARQRAEAVRLAQDSMEEWRGFTTLNTTANHMAYQDIAGESTRSVQGTNATYTVSRRALADADVAGTVTPDRRGVVIDVTWQDRASQAQLVRLSSAVSGVEPELGASLVLSTSSDPLVRPLDRNRAIPHGVVPLGVGRSGLVPPGQSVGGDRIAWVFDNSTALITLCTTPAADTGGLTLANLTCSTDKAVLISGYVRFAVGGPPSDVSVTNPAAPMVPVPFGLSLARTAPDPPSTFSCFQEPMNNSAVPYSCAVGITTTDRQWSGSLVFGPPLAIAASVAVASASQYKVCRYHAAASYTLVGAALANQNFVIIKAGDGSTAYTCPSGGTPNTWPHQPAT